MLVTSLLTIALLQAPASSPGQEVDRLCKQYQKEADRKNIRDESPRHQVRITAPFYVGKYEVTVGQFRWFVKKTGYKTDGEKGGFVTLHIGGKWVSKKDASWRNTGLTQVDSHPVVCTSWRDATRFCTGLSSHAGVKITLPTEAQWEYACRAGTDTAFSFGGDSDSSRLDDYAWHWQNSGKTTHPVGQKKPSPWGLYDIMGNAFERCLDSPRRYSRSSQTDPAGPDAERRAVRGGSWQSSHWRHRSAYRYSFRPHCSANCIGFRVSMQLPSGDVKAGE